MSPALRALAEACYPRLDWLAAQTAAAEYAKDQQLSTWELKAVAIPEYKSCRCTCCGDSHAALVQAPGVYFNGRLVEDIAQEAINKQTEANWRV